ncbi:MAG: response regulator transcription factor [Anaerolineae bacterium]|nr:response regulator transcription factor [Anaerolineae bacterium]
MRRFGGDAGMAIRVVLADDRDLALLGAQTVLTRQPGEFELTGSFQEWPALLAHLANAAPEVIVLSDRLEPETDVLSLVQSVRETASRSHVIVIGHVSDGLVVHELFHGGVDGYLYKSDRLEESLVEAIRAVVRGRPYLSPTAGAEYLLALYSGRADWRMDDEAREVLRQMARGLRPQEIALKRGVPVRRIYWVGNKLRQRFGAQTNEHLIARAAAEGFL